MPEDIQDKVAQAGELLIRAAAVIGTLTVEQQEALSKATDGKLTDCLAWAIEGAAVVSPAVAQSLKTNGPAGFTALNGGQRYAKTVPVDLPGDFKAAMSQILRSGRN